MCPKGERRIRKRYSLLAGAFLLLFALIALSVLAGWQRPVDRAVAGAVQAWRTPALTAGMKAITYAGEWLTYIPGILLLIGIPRTRKAIGLPLGAVYVVAAVGSWLLKLLFAVSRPEAPAMIDVIGYGFPSGHAMIASAVAGFGCVLFVCRPYEARKKAVFLVAAAAFILLVGISRVYLGVHSPSDVIGGYAGGLCVCFGFAAIGNIQGVHPS